MENYSATLFEDDRHERSSISLLSLTDRDKLKQSNFTHSEINKVKCHALEKLHRRTILKEYIPVLSSDFHFPLIEYCFVQKGKLKIQNY